jgi:hypothetical protein
MLSHAMNMVRTEYRIDVTGIWTMEEARNFTDFVSKLVINETSKTNYNSQI